MHHNMGVMKSRYCVGMHDDMINIGPQKKIDCLKMHEGKAARKEAYDPTPKMKGKGAPPRRK
ncbi:hypothetical protein PR003_g3119 [Phytophthora rubi]|uniref:Uncharacterized protein n=1 Tax=Phytophthora rubi TaxID=129364 RepID=A0A6A3L3H3_9STRA|nr:hypothetical protein PR002_g14754 [Phytophthora rubi]KAE9018538.1 hypothetical protein PR001_g14109 [Phytophthora rubi]KAE9354901.1 hypothetical protein PR003_g3119 [Phytophthora rubi]